jgi:hypothetical protein
MPNTLTLTAAVTIPNCRAFRIDTARFDEDNAVGEVLVRAVGLGGFLIAQFALTIRNGTCDAAQANGAATSVGDVVKQVQITSATAFTQCLAAYRTSRDSLLTTLATLGILPAGTVS